MNANTHTPLIEIPEHGTTNNREIIDKVKKLLEIYENILPPKYLCLTIFNNTVQASYYIGITWITEDQIIYVKPKIELDYIKILTSCAKHPEVLQHLKEAYKIYYDEPPIPINPAQIFDLTPFIILNFLGILKTIVKKGLKKNYIFVEENLSSKVKGKILKSANLKNLFKARPDKVYCRYQEYSYNCPENKILKKALVFSAKFLQKNYSFSQDLVKLLIPLKRAFQNIDENISVREIKHIKIHPLYKEYKEAVALAKLILKQFDYSITNVEKNSYKIHPFHIDMAKLFELYVYSLLLDTFNKVKFQFNAYYGKPDFLLPGEKAILDAKYKTGYENSYNIEDIRQLAGYSRDNKVRTELNLNGEEIPECVIIYPSENSNESIQNYEKLKENPIKQFCKFYKYGITLPVK